MREGWKCPNCGKAHGPHVDTCPETAQVVIVGLPPVVTRPPAQPTGPRIITQPFNPGITEFPVITSGSVVAARSGLAIN